MDLIASAPSIERLEALINRYYYSKNWVVKDNKAYNTILDESRGTVELKRKRYRFLL